MSLHPQFFLRRHLPISIGHAGRDLSHALAESLHWLPGSCSDFDDFDVGIIGRWTPWRGRPIGFAFIARGLDITVPNYNSGGFTLSIIFIRIGCLRGVRSQLVIQVPRVRGGSQRVKRALAGYGVGMGLDQALPMLGCHGP